MRQYKITRAEFYTPGDTGEPDAFLSPEDLALVQQQAGQSGMIFNVTNNPLPAIQPAIREQLRDGKTARNRIS